MTTVIKYPLDSEVYKIAYKFFSKKKKDMVIQASILKQGKIEYFNKQCEFIEKVNRLDKISFKWISKIVDLILNDDFWFSQVHGLAYLRKLNKEKIRYCYIFLNKVGGKIGDDKIDMNIEPPQQKNIIKIEKGNEDKPIKVDKEEIKVDDIMGKWKTRTDLIALQKLNEC